MFIVYPSGRGASYDTFLLLFHNNTDYNIRNIKEKVFLQEARVGGGDKNSYLQ